MMEKELRVKETKFGKLYIMDVNIPIDDALFFKEWHENCQEDFQNGRWRKIISNHNFVKNFKEDIEFLKQEIKEIKEMIENGKNKK
jgi:hypothetical protein